MNLAINNASVSAQSPSTDFPYMPDDAIARLVSDIDTVGYGVVPDYVSRGEIHELRAFVEDACRKAGNQYVGFTGSDEVSGTTLERMAKSPTFRRLCERVYEHATGRPAPDDAYYQILRCLTGTSGQQHSMRFHYDSYVLTVLLPIHVPEGKQSGALVVLPNTRKIRSTYARNLVDKVLVDNPLTQRLLKRMADNGSQRLVQIKMEPGNLYLFWGYRSIHTNQPCDPDKIRATALFHYVDPHRDSTLKRILRS